MTELEQAYTRFREVTYPSRTHFPSFAGGYAAALDSSPPGYRQLLHGPLDRDTRVGDTIVPKGTVIIVWAAMPGEAP